MTNKRFRILVTLAVCILTPACSQDFGDNLPHVEESRAEQAENMKKSQARLQEIQKAASQCATIAWKISYLDTRSKVVSHLYPFTPGETGKAREIFLTRAHPVMADYTVHPTPPRLSNALCFLDASGKELATISSDSLGCDSSTTSNGYQYCARISMPDADREFLSNAGNKEKREKDAGRFYKKAK